MAGASATTTKVSATSALLIEVRLSTSQSTSLATRTAQDPEAAVLKALVERHKEVGPGATADEIEYHRSLIAGEPQRPPQRQSLEDPLPPRHAVRESVQPENSSWTRSTPSTMTIMSAGSVHHPSGSTKSTGFLIILLLRRAASTRMMRGMYGHFPWSNWTSLQGVGWGGVDGIGWGGVDGIGWDWMGLDWMGWDGMRWDGVGWVGVGWGEVGWD